MVVGYSAGWLLDKVGVPRIVGYIATGIVLSPHTINFIDYSVIKVMEPILEICLTFIAFEVGGTLKWAKIRRHENEILSITIMASLVPFVIIAVGVYLFSLIFPALFPFDPANLILLALLLGALASPTAPAATLAVIHEYNAKGKVTDTILGVVALDDVLGILLFSITISLIFIFREEQIGLFGHPILNSAYQLIGAILIGVALGFIIDPMSKFFEIKGEGQWVVILFSIIILNAGISNFAMVDELLSSMAMGMVVANKCRQRTIIFRILRRYTEDLIFLFFFLLSGMHLEISTIPKATVLIILFVLLRTTGKYAGTALGARMVKTDPLIQRYTAGGLLPQAGVVIGLVLSVYQLDAFKEISEILLTTIMGATIVHELIGPAVAKRSLIKAGEIKLEDHNK